MSGVIGGLFGGNLPNGIDLTSNLRAQFVAARELEFCWRLGDYRFLAGSQLPAPGRPAFQATAAVWSKSLANNKNVYRTYGCAMQDFSIHDRSHSPNGDTYLAVHESREVGSFMSGRKSGADRNAERRRCGDVTIMPSIGK